MKETATVRRAFLPLAMLTVCLTLASCSALSPQRRRADQRAQEIQHAIEDHYGPWPLAYAVRPLLGPLSGLHVLRVSGTTWHGNLTLSITDSNDGAFGTDYTRCYEYRFDHLDHHGGDQLIGMSKCPPARSIELPRPPAEPFGERGIATLNHRLDTLPTPRDVAQVRTLVAHTYPPPAVVNVGRDGSNIDVKAWLDLSCVYGHVATQGPGHASVHFVVTNLPECGS